MIRTIFLLLFIHSISFTYAGKISGTITDNEGNLLPYASVIVKGTSSGTTANSKGDYFLNLDQGTYIIVCQHVGYRREEKRIVVNQKEEVLDFVLLKQELTLEEVVIQKGEDPAYQIIRNAIEKRSYYKNQVNEFQSEVYTKGQLQLRDFPKKFFGQKVDFEDGDTSKRKMLYLSESIARYSVKQPDDVKIEVLSTKVSGESDGFGLSAPQIYSFYDNNVNIGSGLNPRGFISPVSNNALNFYRYKYEGFFVEEGKQVFRIKVMPRRLYEPLFSGYIFIVDEDWRIHSLQLELTKTSQMQVVDTLRIEQLYVPLTKDVWVVKSQVIYPAIKMLGFDAYGSFVNVYSHFNINPNFKKGFFDNTILKYTDSSNKKSRDYWEKARPLPLQTEEATDYKKKDSLEQLKKNPAYMDSISRRRNRLNIARLFYSGQSFTRESKRRVISIPNLLEIVKYNTVEGLVVNPQLTYVKKIDTGSGRRAISISPQMRYGFGNNHFNASTEVAYTYGKKYVNSIQLAGGKNVLQFNKNSLQGERGATLSALFFKNNRRKIYEAWFARAQYLKSFGDGFSATASLEFQDREPLENTTFYSFSKTTTHNFTPNYPEEFAGPDFKKHQAFITSLTISWRPGNRYIEFSDKKISIGSKYPSFALSYTKGIRTIFGSDIDYDKWRLSITDDINLKLAGSLNYRISTGGFLNAKNVQIPDYFHLNGNKSILASDYLVSFQLVPHYKYSNTENLFSTAFAEYHLNGFLTNKIPLFRRLNWHLVAGTNAFYTNSNLNYVEIFGGVENIFRIIRIDFVQGYLNGQKNSAAVRIGISGLTNR